MFNRILVGDEPTDFVLFVRANSTTNTDGDEYGSPDVRVRYAVDDQWVEIIYANINYGVCKTFESGTTKDEMSQSTVPMPSAVVCNGNVLVSQYTVVHELAHLFEYRSGYPIKNAIAAGTFALGSCPSIEFDSHYTIMGYFANREPHFQRGTRGWGSGPGFSDFQQNATNDDPDEATTEAAADMFLNWTYRLVDTSDIPQMGALATDGTAQAMGCIPKELQLNPAVEDWLGFLNMDWPKNSYDWGMPGDIRYVYMQHLLEEVFELHLTW